MSMIQAHINFISLFISGNREDSILEGDTELSGLAGGTRPFSTGVVDGRRVVFIT